MKTEKMTFDKAFGVVSNVAVYISSVILIFIAILIFIDVIMRYVFNSPIPGQQELAEMGTAIVVYFGLPFATRIRNHVRVEPITDKLPPKAKNILYGILDMIIVVFMAFLTWKVFKQATILSKTPGNATMILRIPNFWLYYVCSLGGLISTVEFLLDGLKYFAAAGKSSVKEGGMD